MVTVEQLKSDLVRGLKARDTMMAGVLRYLLSELHNAEKAKQGKGEVPVLSENEALHVLQKEYKRRQEAIALFAKGKRDDLVKAEEAELAIIRTYLPKQLEKNEVETVVDRLIAQGSREFTALMKEAMKELRGKADGRLVAEVAKERLREF